MKYLKLLLVGTVPALIFILAIFALTAQTPEAEITVEAISPQDITNNGWSTPPYYPSSGLTNVGKGELVYLTGRDASGEEVTSYSWTLTSLPTGSAVTLDSTNTRMTTFRPDTTGEFDIQLSITTASGAADTTITINSATYVGAGGFSGLPVKPDGLQCGTGCHSGIHTAWQGTRHSTKFQRDIDGGVSFYSETCLKCHTVGYDTTAVNDGFDDVAKEQSWTIPATLQPGNWDSMVANFPEVAHKANIQCENCHGPGSEHRGDPTKIDFKIDDGVCGKCHDALTHHPKGTQWRRSAHARGVSFAAGRDFCNRCHSGYGFIDRMDGKPESEWRTGFQQISCAVCHDPHSAKNEHQLRKVDPVTLENGEVVTFGGIGKFCMQCHHARENAETYAQEWHSRFGPHHNPQADMLAGTNAIEFGLDIPSSNHRFYVEEACVQCHMAETPAEGEPGHNFIGEHTWAMHAMDDNGTPDDPSDDVEVYNVAACRECHGPNINKFTDIRAKRDYDGDGVIEAAQDEVRGLMDELGKLLPPLGEPEIAIETNPTVDPGYTPVQLKAAYNYMFVLEDQSYGVHNFQYAINLLETARRALTTGDLGAGTIMSIADVPNDQGKQVRVVWNRFGGDGVGDDPVQSYSMWRRVDDSATNGAQQTQSVYESLQALPLDAKSLNEGVQLQLDGELWDFAGAVPAASQEMYSAIAPTLYDSTITNGMHWSVFKVVGHTSNPAVFAASAPDSGYSLDNLVPAA
nr:hypothetical protein [candidate division KSB1 bacterium]NIR69332.1 hypothetical protein [candidate division KSB1 bacterium]NIS24150.1 hypothetical protein [candidate division KSB1 bacterium]NIT71065.1 hypothetical protein [candidate division KSB1 bacterium]NIU24769.1 hypothetical protein [candidate division KSB1 bacterium]